MWDSLVKILAAYHYPKAASGQLREGEEMRSRFTDLECIALLVRELSPGPVCDELVTVQGGITP